MNTNLFMLFVYFAMVIIYLTVCLILLFQFIDTAPVVVTTTTIPVPPSTGYPAQHSTVGGYPMPQPQPG